MIKVSDYIFNFLEKNNVDRVFMLSGGTAMHLDDSLGKCKNIKYIACHHEQACAMAAESYSKFTGNMGVALVTSGPGATNTITGVAGAYLDSVPCMFISGQAKIKQTVINSEISNLRQFGVQEINIIPIVESITKYAVTITEPKKIRYHLEKALYLAKNGRSGPVWIDVPLDIQNMKVDENELVKFDPNELIVDYKLSPEENEIEDVIELIKNAKRPVIVGGHGIRLAGGIDELHLFAQKYNIPIVTPFMGIDIINSDSENYIGRIGTKGTRAGNLAMQNADLLLCIGTRLSVSSVGHEYSLFAREATKVVIDIDTDEHRKNTIKINKFINSDAKIFLTKLLEAIQNVKIDNNDWLIKCNDWKSKYPVCLKEYEEVKEGINYYYFVDKLTKAISAETTIVSDAGSAFYVACQAVNIQKGQRYITSGGLATMGFNLPAAIGVSWADVTRPVAIITGEGSFQQNIQELQTIKHHNLPIKIFVVNNNGYFSIKQTQKRFFNENYVGEGTKSGLSFPETSNIADAYGIKFLKAENNSELDTVLCDVINYNGPVICEIISLENQEIIPTVSSAINKNGVMVSKPLEDMYPFLSKEELKKEMFVETIDE